MADTRGSIIARIAALLAGAGFLLAVTLTVLGHLYPGPGYNPVRVTLSDYAIAHHGEALTVAMVVLSLASLALLAGLVAARVPVRGLPGVLMAVWVAGLLLSAAVPTDPLGQPLSRTGLVHRYASVSAFVALPTALYLLGHRPYGGTGWAGTRRALRRLAIVCAAGLLLMLYVAYPGQRVLLGLVERSLVAVEVGMLGALATCLYRSAARPTVPAARLVSGA